MRHVKTNQELIVGRKYLCRTKPVKLHNGSFSKPEISILHVGEDQGRRYVGPNKFWAYDQHDGIISWNGQQRLEAEAKAMNLPISEMSVILSDYEVNSQALERWDMVGPIPEIKEGILHALFDYPELISYFDIPISLHTDGSIAIQKEHDGEDWLLLTDIETIQDVFGKPDKPTEENDMRSANNEKPSFQREMLNDGKITFKENGNGWKTVVLTETKYVSDGFYPKGTMFILGAWVEHKKGFDLMNANGEVVLTGINDGFAIPEYEQQPKGFSNLNFGNHGNRLFSHQPNGFNSADPTMHIFKSIDNVFDSYIDRIRPNMGMYPTPATRQEKLVFIQQYMYYLQTQP